VNELDARLSWIDRSSIESGYEVEMSNADRENWTALSTLPSNTSAFLRADCEIFVPIFFRVRAVAAAGKSGWGYAEGEVPGRAPPHPPELARAVALSPTSVQVSWRDVSRIEEQYVVYRSSREGTVRAGLLDVNTELLLDSTVSPNSSYTYQIRAVNRHFQSNQVRTDTVTTPGPPDTTSALWVGGESPSEIRINWRINWTRLDGLILEDRLANENRVPCGDTIQDPDFRTDSVSEGRVKAYRQPIVIK